MSDQDKRQTTQEPVGEIDPTDPQSWRIERRSEGRDFYYVSVSPVGASSLRANNQRDAKKLLADYRMSYATSRYASIASVAQNASETPQKEEGKKMDTTTNTTPETTTDVQDGDQTLEAMAAVVETISNASVATTLDTVTRKGLLTADEIATIRARIAELTRAGFKGAYGQDPATISDGDKESRALQSKLSTDRHARARGTSGTTVTRISGAAAGTAASKALRAGKSDPHSATLFVLHMLAREDQTMTVEQLSCVLGERYAAAITLPVDENGKIIPNIRPVEMKSVRVTAKVAAIIADTTADEFAAFLAWKKAQASANVAPLAAVVA